MIRQFSLIRLNLLSLLALALTACQAATLPPALLADLPADTQSLWQVELGPTPGASLAVSIAAIPDAIPQTASQTGSQAGFGLKNSSGGAAAGDPSQILAYRVFVVESASAPSGALSPASGIIVTVPANGIASQTIVFSNLPAGSYYACAAAFETNTGFSPGLNLSDPLTALTTYAEGPSFCSNSGGGAQPGQVIVDAARQLSTPGLVGISLKLRGARGASIETAITVTDGL